MANQPNQDGAPTVVLSAAQAASIVAALGLIGNRVIITDTLGSTLTYTSHLRWDGTNFRLAVGNSDPALRTEKLQVYGDLYSSGSAILAVHVGFLNKGSYIYWTDISNSILCSAANLFTFAASDSGTSGWRFRDVSTSLDRLYIDAKGYITVDYTLTAAGTTGNRTINKGSGSIRIAAAGTTVTCTNSFCNANSIVLCALATNDATAYIKNVVPGAGSFVITLGAAATGEVEIRFLIINR